MSIEDRVRKVVSEQLDVNGEIDNNASFIDDLGADSLDTVELVMSLEEEFDCEIADEEAENIQPFNKQSTTLTQIHNIHQ